MKAQVNTTHAFTGLYIVNESDRPCELCIAGRLADGTFRYIHPDADRSMVVVADNPTPLDYFGISWTLGQGHFSGRCVGKSVAKYASDGAVRNWQGHHTFKFPIAPYQDAAVNPAPAEKSWLGVVCGSIRKWRRRRAEVKLARISARLAYREGICRENGSVPTWLLDEVTSMKGYCAALRKKIEHLNER